MMKAFKVEEYKTYVDEHIHNVKSVWIRFNVLLQEYIFIDDCEYWEIHQNILNHDKSKYSDQELYGYAQYFYPEATADKDIDVFNYAWNHHQKKNPHHWEYWLLITKENNKIVTKPLKMPFVYVIEMLCDWGAMSYKFNNIPSEWYTNCKEEMLLEESTRRRIEKYLSLLDEAVKRMRE